MSTLKMKRRTVLRGVLGGAGVSIGLPALEAMFNANGTAHADGTALPRRLGIFFWGNGAKLDRWDPTATGPNYPLSPELMPLTPVKDYVSVVSGTNVMTGNPQGHHAGTVGILSGSPMVVQAAAGAPFRSTFSAPSVDQVAAAKLYTGKGLKSLEVGISTRVNIKEGTTLQHLSHNGPDMPNPADYSAISVFNRLFGMGFSAPGGMPVTDVTKKLRRSVLDAVAVDISKLSTRVSTFDKQRLDEHTANIRELENRLQNDTVLPAMCKPPMAGTISDNPDQNGNEMLAEKTQAMSDLIAMAFACDQTRVFSMMYSGSTAFTMFWQTMASEGHHSMTHDEAGAQPLVHASTVFTMQCFSSLLQAIKKVPEGAGNALDNTVIYASSDTADGRAHSLTDYPIVVAGKGGGFLKYPGVHYASKGENSSIVLLTVLRAAGLQLTQFGGGGGMVTNSCTAIEA
ncbi:MAG TPA: DUF1552 domain-containing protein [Polyangia bacterium]|nr:DUF1552 domain-containing protein [Polyangia bacterium]